MALSEDMRAISIAIRQRGYTKPIALTVVPTGQVQAIILALKAEDVRGIFTIEEWTIDSPSYLARMVREGQDG